MKKAKKKARRRTVTRQGVVRPVDTGETFEDLEKLAAKKGAATIDAAKHPTGTVSLKLNRVRVAEKVFQWRTLGPNRVPSDDHILEMARAVNETEEPLAPILVLPLGDWFYVVDGHHRLAAYLTAKWKGGIPARLFKGTLEDAWREALLRNVKNKLPMTKRDKINAAWRIVKNGDPRDSIAVTMRLSGVSKGTVDNMRRVWKRLNEEKKAPLDELVALSWGRAQILANGFGEEAELDDWLEAEADKLVAALLRAKLGGRLTKRPDVTALALSKLNESLPAALVEEWREPPPFDPHDTEGDIPF